MPTTSSTHSGIRDRAHKAERVSFAATTGQLATIDEAVQRLGWDRSTFMRHAAIMFAENVNANEALRDGGLLLAIAPPVSTGIPA
ncbi:hypothetical protein ACVU7I_01795 [Patulibacter sp. S7RM1-6]